MAIEARLLDIEGADQWFGDVNPEAAVARDSEGSLYLLAENEDGVFYVGIPMGEDEDGTSVDTNAGWLDPDRRTKSRYGPAFPLEVLATGRTAMFVNGGKTLAEMQADEEANSVD